MLTTFTGRVGDHNDQAMRAAALLGDRIAQRWGCDQQRVGTSAPALDTDWRTELAAAHDPLAQLALAVREAGRSADRWLTVMPRCAGALATLPMVCEQRRDVCVVWFDAHADLHLPETTTSGYLGGMALSGPLGWWDSGFGAGVGAAVLAGTRDVDSAEERLIDERGIAVVAPGPDFAERLDAAVGERPVYVHLDCDVLEPGIVPTDYQVPCGLDLTTLHAGLASLSAREVIGLEVAELEDHPDADTDADADSQPELDALLTAVSPLLDLVADS